MRAEDVCLELLLFWLAEAHGRRFALEGREDVEPAGCSALAVDGPYRLAVEVRPLIPIDNEPWRALRDQLQEEIAAGLPGGFALWMPPGADLPSPGDESEAFVRLVQETARGLRPGERSFVPFPVSIYLRKTREDGALVSVVGGLNPHWARLSERVRGTYDLDSSRLHRLPESEEHLRELLERIWRQAESMQPGQWAEIETVDAWTIQRLRGEEGVAIIGVPPEATVEMGLAVRRNLRRILAEAGPRLRERPADLRALVVLGHYGRMEEEGTTTALRGYDPSLYSGLDFLCLAADGLLKPIIEAPAHVLPWSRR